ncbi:bifunctional helix-turn-helix transcriptional regulator/GNAT family N-acetyltransferase [Hymenobacter guriensis]|uniref:Bifunctional helix-turn-helix transcriptional regulator/GNAT family N-acetyltransferase n=1 Tax=Hymenobacter guriensis TaxID=2793065 RepID=A0ABS0L0Z0_9BACT|nr:bifunctional helix-turn-helix transcriptional regulator/GNAT family N-acetyltransferase [Hymenobacter guriensis]MBG8553774.1 bifunctional helix-turn-helix transcriptional regulator/GNAT family N-acetyltransferase [Hymenobacter guriensis]
MNFFAKVGPAALGSRLRRLNDLMTSQAAEVYASYQVPFEPRWFPVFWSVAADSTRHVSDIAEQIGQTHAAVSQVVKDLMKHGLVEVQRGETDQRRSIIALTDKGASLWPALQEQTADVRQATEALLAETRHNLWLAIEEVEYALSRQSLASRVKAMRSERLGSEVRILDYEPRYQPDFKQLNLTWIEQYFRVEEPDLLALDHPDTYILEKGGHILLAAYQNRIVGACALLWMEDDTYELAKMAVAPTAQGLGIGFRLGEAAIAKARMLGARRLYLESNTKLKPAIQLYHKLGFQKTVAGQPSPYERCNIQMELLLS